MFRYLLLVSIFVTVSCQAQDNTEPPSEPTKQTVEEKSSSTFSFDRKKWQKSLTDTVQEYYDDPSLSLEGNKKTITMGI